MCSKSILSNRFVMKDYIQILNGLVFMMLIWPIITNLESYEILHGRFVLA